MQKRASGRNGKHRQAQPALDPVEESLLPLAEYGLVPFRGELQVRARAAGPEAACRYDTTSRGLDPSDAVRLQQTELQEVPQAGPYC